MSDRLIQLQVFYEIAMAIDASLDLKPMLKTALSSYLRKLNCSLGVVLALKHNPDGTQGYEHVFSIPRQSDRNEAYNAALTSIPTGVNAESLLEFERTLPLKGEDRNGRWFHVMSLPAYGALILAKSGEGLNDDVVNFLSPLNAKLAGACLACLDRARVHEMNDILRDEISVRLQAEAALLESEKYLKTIFDSVQAGILIIDRDSKRVVEANSHAIELMETTRAKLIGLVCHERLCPNSIGNCPVTDEQRSIDNNECVLVKATGEKILVLKTATDITIGGKRYLLESFVDISESKRLEAQLLQTQKMEAIGNLAGGIAHDFNNILGSIIGNTELVCEDLPEDCEAQQFLRDVLVAGGRGKELIQQILTFGRQSGSEHEPVEVGGVTTDTLKMLGSTLPSSVAIKQDITGGGHIIMANRIQLQQVLLNLCTNAAHAMSDGGTLTVLVGKEMIDDTRAAGHPDLKPGPYVRITVNDTGHGIEPNIITKIFNPFFTTKGPGKGSGMGLSVVHGIVHNHKGAILAESTPGTGTTFDVFFPSMNPLDVAAAEGSDDPGGRQPILK